MARAPLRETLAAAILLGAGWDGTTPLVDVEIHLVAVDKANKLTRLPANVVAMARLKA